MNAPMRTAADRGLSCWGCPNDFGGPASPDWSRHCYTTRSSGLCACPAPASLWPGAAPSALLFAIDNIEVMLDGDVTFGAYLEEAGIRATIYTIGDFAKQSAPRLRTLIGRGHELAIQADKYVAFSGQPKDFQAKRIDSALARFGTPG